MTVEALAETIESDPFVAQLVEHGFEAAARSAAEEKRWMLAKVVAAAVRGDDARIHELDLFLRTVTELEPYHVRVLCEIASPRVGVGRLAGTSLEGAWDEEELAIGSSEDRHLVGAIASTLAREHLIRDLKEGKSPAAWVLT